MKREDIYEGMSGIGPDLIEEAEKHVFAARRKPKIFRWAAAAAVFVLTPLSLFVSVGFLLCIS